MDNWYRSIYQRLHIIFFPLWHSDGRHIFARKKHLHGGREWIKKWQDVHQYNVKRNKFKVGRSFWEKVHIYSSFRKSIPLQTKNERILQKSSTLTIQLRHRPKTRPLHSPPWPVNFRNFELDKHILEPWKFSADDKKIHVIHGPNLPSKKCIIWSLRWAIKRSNKCKGYDKYVCEFGAKRRTREGKIKSI